MIKRRKSKQKWLTGLGAPASLGWSDYFAATVLSVGKDFILDRILLVFLGFGFWFLVFGFGFC